MRTNYPSNLSDAEWEALQRHLPPLPKRGRPPIHSLRAIFNAIFYVLRTGCPWRYLPATFPLWQTVFYHFRRLRLKGIWTHLLRALHQAERQRQGRNPHPRAAIIDAQSVKTVEESAGISGFDAHKHVKGWKRHILVDTRSHPHFHLCDPCRHPRYQGSPLSARWIEVLCSTPGQDLGRCSVSEPGVGCLVPSHRRMGTGGRGTPSRHPQLQRGTTQMSSRANIQLDFSQLALEQGLRA
jgi:transposase